MLIVNKDVLKLRSNPSFICILISILVKVQKDIKVESRITNHSRDSKVLLLNHVVILLYFVVLYVDVQAFPRTVFELKAVLKNPSLCRSQIYCIIT